MSDLKRADTIAVKLTPEQFRLAKQRAQQAAFGGRSQIRDQQKRQAMLLEDAVVGQAGNLAWSLYHFGTDHYYQLTRHVANVYPASGDGGYDILGLTVDVKTSAIRSKLPLGEYHLAVRPEERHRGWVYVLALAQLSDAEDQGCTVYLVGWLKDDELPEYPAMDGVFKGAFIKTASQLHPLPAFCWPTVQQSVVSGIDRGADPAPQMQ